MKEEKKTKITWHTSKKVYGKVSKTKGFKDAYEKELKKVKD